MTKFGTTTFAYDDAGVRIRKGTTEYYAEGTRILAEKRNGTMIYYFYDESGVAGFEYGGKKYYYQKNLQGDVLGIYDDCGNLLGSYLYDARGKILAQSTNNILIVNPFRYRGYYYDTETSLYYLNTRYYDPETGRFISPDSTDYLDPVAINGLNLYAYCGNNPVMNVDPEGNSWDSFWSSVGNWFEDNWQILVSSAEIVIGCIALFVPGGQGAAALLLSAGVSSIVSGYVNEYLGNSFFSGWLGGQLSGLIGGVAGIVRSAGKAIALSFISGVVGNLTTGLIDKYGYGANVSLSSIFLTSMISGGVSSIFGIASLPLPAQGITEDLMKNAYLYVYILNSSFISGFRTALSGLAGGVIPNI